MTDLSTVLHRMYLQAAQERPMPDDTGGPEPSWVWKILMPAVVAVGKVDLGELTRHQTVSPADIDQIQKGFAGEWWLRTQDLASRVAPLTAEVVLILKNQHGVQLRGERLRGMRQKATSRLAATYRQTGGLPEEQEWRSITDELVISALYVDHEVLGEAAFVALLIGPYEQSHWPQAVPSTQTLRLGHRDRPPLADGRFRTVLVGTDRDLFSRYRLYYNLKARSQYRQVTEIPDAYSIERYLDDTSADVVALNELDRGAQPYGLRHTAHHQVLPATLAALTPGKVRGGAPIPEVVEAAGPVDGTETRTHRLARVFAKKFGNENWRIGIDLDDLEGYVMRRVWNDLHRWERENESAAPWLWYLAKFKSAVTQYPNDRAVVARKREATADVPVERMDRDGARLETAGRGLIEPVRVLPHDPDEALTDSVPPSPELMVHVVFETLSQVEPPVLLDWIREIDSRDIADVHALTGPVCRARGFDHDARAVVAALALRALRSLATA